MRVSVAVGDRRCLVRGVGLCVQVRDAKLDPILNVVGTAMRQALHIATGLGIAVAVALWLAKDRECFSTGGTPWTSGMYMLYRWCSMGKPFDKGMRHYGLRAKDPREMKMYQDLCVYAKRRG